MAWPTAVFVYLVIWWTILFAVLPWGMRRVENPEPGHDAGAPLRPMLIKKFLWTSVVAAVLWLGYYAIYRYDVFSFR